VENEITCGKICGGIVEEAQDGDRSEIWIVMFVPSLTGLGGLGVTDPRP